MTQRAASIVWVCARLELVLSARSRWIQIFAAVFAVLALLVAGSGYVLSGGAGIQDFSRTAAALLQLVLLIVPLTSVLFSVMALTPDSGAAEMLFSQPVERHQVLVGKLAGLWLALAASEGVGFGMAGLVLFARTGSDGIGGFLGVLGGALVLTAVFLCLGAALVAGRTSEDRARGLATALVVWFVSVLLFDVAALGVASLLQSGSASRLLMAAAIVNPVDAVRTGVLMALEGTTAFGAASLAFLRFTGGTSSAFVWLGASIVVWIVIPFAAAVIRLRRAEI